MFDVESGRRLRRAEGGPDGSVVAVDPRVEIEHGRGPLGIAVYERCHGFLHGALAACAHGQQVAAQLAQLGLEVVTGVCVGLHVTRTGR